MNRSKFIIKKKNMIICIDLDSILYFENSLRKVIVP
jgi:DNA-binding LytR/AlgR family response regulator